MAKAKQVVTVKEEEVPQVLKPVKSMSELREYAVKMLDYFKVWDEAVEALDMIGQNETLIRELPQRKNELVGVKASLDEYRGKVNACNAEIVDKEKAIAKIDDEIGQGHTKKKEEMDKKLEAHFEEKTKEGNSLLYGLRKKVTAARGELKGVTTRIENAKVELQKLKDSM